jgi:hypothetical protein
VRTIEEFVDSDRGSARSASQQQADRVESAQHALAALLALVVEQADAAPAIGSMPMIAARTIKGSRR